MSTQSEHKRNERSTETHQQLRDTKEQTDSILQRFDALTSKFDRFIFKYTYIYLPGLFFGELLLVPTTIVYPQARSSLLVLAVSVLPMIIIVLDLWLFNAWRLSIPKTLRDLLEKKSIYLPNENLSTTYLCFLEAYHNALANQKRYFFCVFPIIVLSGLSIYLIVRPLSSSHVNIFVTLLFLVGSLLSLLSYLGVLYCVGIATWVMYISGWYIRKLARTFEFKILPVHTDKCGGLKMLGNFCFGLVSPLLISSGLSIGYIFIYFISGGINGFGGGIYGPNIPDMGTLVISRVLFAGFPLLLLFLYIFPAIVFTFIFPLWDIHTKMVGERETDEDMYNTSIQTLREEIQSLLKSDEIEKAKALQEKMGILETLHTPYPTWPFSLRSKILSTLLGTGGSLLIGMATAAIPIILSNILHNP